MNHQAYFLRKIKAKIQTKVLSAAILLSALRDKVNVLLYHSIVNKDTIFLVDVIPIDCFTSKMYQHAKSANS